MAKSFDDLVKTDDRQEDAGKGRDSQPGTSRGIAVERSPEIGGKSQQQVARALGIKQPSLSKLEKQSDMQISTLQKIVEALGGELEVLARFPKGMVRIDQFDRVRRRTGNHRSRASAYLIGFADVGFSIHTHRSCEMPCFTPRPLE